jgi:hypothetical protein
MIVTERHLEKALRILYFSFLILLMSYIIGCTSSETQERNLRGDVAELRETISNMYDSLYNAIIGSESINISGDTISVTSRLGSKYRLCGDAICKYTRYETFYILRGDTIKKTIQVKLDTIR